jgi:cytochrome c
MSSTGKDSLLGNKILAGLLTAGIILWAANRIAGVVVSDESPKTPAIAITGLQTAAAPVASTAPAVSIDTLFATADVAKGQALVAQQCSACHTLAKGGASGVGPNLYGILGAKAFGAAGFTYSSAVASKAGKPWTPDSLSAWLQNPATFAPGTDMSFAGIKNDQSRANVIAYLNSNSDTPAKLP